MEIFANKIYSFLDVPDDGGTARRKKRKPFDQEKHMREKFGKKEKPEFLKERTYIEHLTRITSAINETILEKREEYEEDSMIEGSYPIIGVIIFGSYARGMQPDSEFAYVHKIQMLIYI